MVIQIIIYLLTFLACVIFLYSIYKVIWYAIKTTSFRSMMMSLNDEDGIRVESLRSFWNMILGARGDPDYYVTVKGKRYEISVLSFITIHGRWSLEKTRTGHVIEARRLATFFYSKKQHLSVAGSEHERKRELRLIHKPLYLTKKDEEYAMQILLVYPEPMRITYSDHQYTELQSGDTVADHTIMNVQDLWELIHSE
ncbi:MAG: hypothetical protein IJD38_03675 [Clostridia bacterium]|nr:hypothetical protein [Clostridia bacterium]